ncbi:hypothetical protein P7C70_g8015, partial [Phenoliferia sp. Uapishka_3]
MKFLLVCSNNVNLAEFRVPELQSIATLFNFTITYDEQPPDITRPYMVIHLETEEQAKLLASRSISIKTVWHYWADGENYEQLQNNIKPQSDLYEPCTPLTTSWKFLVSSFGQAIALPEQLQVIHSFAWMGFKGPIKLKGADVEIGVFEEYRHAMEKQEKGRVLEEMRWVWMGRKVSQSFR